MANYFEYYTALTGGTSGCLDSIDGNGLSDGDKAQVRTSTGVYFYHLNATSGATDDGLLRIAPDSNAGDKRWCLISTSNRIGALVKLTADETISNNTGTQISWGAEEYDDANFWEGVTNPSRLTVPTGVTRVKVSGNVRWENNSAGGRQAYFKKNGSAFPGHPMDERMPDDTSGYNDGTNISSPIINVSASDYFQFTVYHSSGGDLDVLNRNGTWFAIEAVEFG